MFRWGHSLKQRASHQGKQINQIVGRVDLSQGADDNYCEQGKGDTSPQKRRACNANAERERFWGGFFTTFVVYHD